LPEISDFQPEGSKSYSSQGPVLTRAEEKLLRGLQRRKNREENGLFLAEGVRVVEELLESRLALHLAAISPSLEDTPRGRALAARLEEAGRTERISDADLDRFAATDSPQGVVAAARIPVAAPATIGFGAHAGVLLLDAVQDPGNFGTLVRSADAFGLAAVVALPGTVDPWNPKAVRAAAGSSFRVPILQLDAAAAEAWLRAPGFQFYGADVEGGAVESTAVAARWGLIVGNEGAGLGKEARKLVDTLVAVPIRGHAESLNVGVAAGILLYLLSREL
jgi:TrmH family RNA methyltransferase